MTTENTKPQPAGVIALALTDPTVEINLDRRSIRYQWPTGAHDEHGEHWEHAAVLSISHSRAGANMFAGTGHPNHYSATLTREQQLGDGLRRFELFDGVCLMTEETPRYSPKHFQRFADDALDRLRGLYAAGDERVTRYFESDGGGA